MVSLTALCLSANAFCMDIDNDDIKKGGVKRPLDPGADSSSSKRPRLDDAIPSEDNQTIAFSNHIPLTNQYLNNLETRAKTGDRKAQDRAIWLDYLALGRGIRSILIDMEFEKWEDIENRCLTDDLYATFAVEVMKYKNSFLGDKAFLLQLSFREKLLTNIKERAEKGLPAAQYSLARYYRELVDSNEALPWYEKASENNYPLAQCSYFFILDDEESENPPEKAFTYLTKAANQGLAKAQDELSHVMRRKSDYKASREWCYKALTQGFLPAEEFFRDQLNDMKDHFIEHLAFAMEKNCSFVKNEVFAKVFNTLPPPVVAKTAQPFKTILEGMLGSNASKTGLEFLMFESQLRKGENNSTSRYNPCAIP